MGGSGGSELEDPRTVLSLVASVERLVVAASGLPHFPKDFEPALAETAQSAGMALAFVAVSLVVGLSPGALLAAEVGPEMHGGAQGWIGSLAEAMLNHLPGTEGHWCSSGVGLQSASVWKAFPLLANFCEQSRS